MSPHITSSGAYLERNDESDCNPITREYRAPIAVKQSAKSIFLHPVITVAVAIEWVYSATVI